jgi:hypothetical protein
MDPLGHLGVLSSRTKKVSGDAPSCLDLAHEHSWAGFPNEAIEHLESASFETVDLPDQSRGAMPLVAYALGGLCQKTGQARLSSKMTIPHFLKILILLLLTKHFSSKRPHCTFS